MVRSVAAEAQIEAGRSRGDRRTDVAMNVLQYGMAIVAIAVVTLLAVTR